MASRAATDRFVAAMCKESYFQFFTHFWSTIAAERLISSWYIRKLCDELQLLSERVFADEPKEHDLIWNCPPGTSKSSIVSILWQPWIWTRMPSARFISGSYSERLALELARKSRDVVTSDQYQRLFPEIQLRSDQNAKCLTGDTQVMLGDGSLCRIDQIEPEMKVLSFADGKIHSDSVDAVVCQGMCPVVEIALSDGTVLSATEGHMLYGWNGWRRTGSLKVGDCLAVARQLPEQDGDLDEDSAFLLALWLAEGGKSSTGFRVTNLCPVTESRLREVARHRDWQVRRDDDELFVTMGYQRNDSTPTSFLRQFGLYETCSTDSIRIPREVFSASTDVIREFIGTYLSCDGCVLTKRNIGIQITTISKGMAYDLQLLLKRLGVQASIQSYIPILDGKECSTAYRVSVLSRQSVLRLEGLRVYGKEHLLKQAIEKKSGLVERKGISMIPPEWRSHLEKKPDSSRIGIEGWATRRVVERTAKEQEICLLTEKLEEDIEWRRIESLTRKAPVLTYDIQVKNNSSFIANGVISHNSHFANTRGGMRYACGVGGSVTGSHAHFIAIDDPIDPLGALSDLVLAEANYWMRETIPSRKVNVMLSPTVIIMQRLHQDDPTGNAIERGGRIRHCCLPAEIESLTEVKPASFAEFYEDGLFDSIRLPRLALEETRAYLGEAGYAGQYLQNPVPRGGAMFKVDRLLYAPTPPIKWKRGPVRYWDKAASTTRGSCFSVGVKMGLDENDKIWILDVVRGQWDSGFRERMILNTAFLDGKSIKVIVEQEPAGSGKESAESTVKRLSLAGHRASADKPSGDKELRADPLSEHVNMGNVVLLSSFWNRVFVEEMRFFPRSKYKDQIDAASGAFSMLVRKRLRIGAL